MTDPGMAPERLAVILPHLAHGHGLPEDDVRQIAGGIVVSAREAVALVDDLVNLLRLETGQWVLSPEPLDVAPVLCSILDDVPTTLSVEAPGDGRLVALADRTGLERLLRCLVSHVVAATLADGGIRIGSGGGPDRLDLSIHTTTGAPGGALESVFEPFAAMLGPPGLGLPLARRLAESQGGRLVAAGSEEEGTTFVLSLPRPGVNAP